MWKMIIEFVFRKKPGYMEINKRLLDIKEICKYLRIGQTKARELVRGHNGFGVQIGNRWYADKEKLDHWLEKRME